MKEFMEKVTDFFVTYHLNVIIKLILLVVVGLFLSKVLSRLVKKALSKTKLDIALHGFIATIVRCAVIVIAGIAVLDLLGINTTSLVALLSVVGLAVSLAVQDTVSNFAAGILLLASKPFTIGNYIEGAGVAGNVEAINILHTTLKTVDNKVIFIPNGILSKGNIINYSALPLRRVDIVFSISYEDDFRKAKEIIAQTVSANPLSLKEPEPTIRLSEHSASSLDIVARVWTQNEHYWDLYFDLKEQVKIAFDENGISIPYSQLDVNLRQADSQK